MRQPEVSGNDRMRDRLVIILGTNRSGTTWLNHLLLAHREICGVEYETSLFWSLSNLWRTSLQWDDDLRSRLTPADLARCTRRFCDDLLTSAQAASDRPDARLFLEKTPGTALLLPWVKLVYPDAWFIRITRDGRDVARSMRLRDYGTRSDLYNTQCWVRHEVLANAYLSDVERVVTVRYEDIYQDPLRELARIYARLGVEAYKGLPRELARRSGTAVARYTSDVSVGSGKWRRDVSRRRLGLMYAAGGSTLCDLGYLTPDELSRWRRRPEFWLGRIRRKLLAYGFGRARAAWLFTESLKTRDVPDRDGAAAEAWARLERPYMENPKAIRDAWRVADRR